MLSPLIVLLASFMKKACTPQHSMISSASGAQPSPPTSPDSERSNIGSATSASMMPSTPSLPVRSFRISSDSVIVTMGDSEMTGKIR